MACMDAYQPVPAMTTKEVSKYFQLSLVGRASRTALFESQAPINKCILRWPGKPMPSRFPCGADNIFILVRNALEQFKRT